MDPHSLECLDFNRVREILSRYAMSGLGKGVIENIQPITRRELIQRWFDQIAELQRFAEDHGMPPFGGISDVRETVLKCAPPLRVTVDDVALIRNTLLGTHAMSAYLRDLPEDLTELAYLAKRIGDFEPLAERIAGVIDERGEVRDDASPKLARIRRDIASAQTRVHTTVERILRDPAIRRVLQFANHTFHNDRLVLPVRTECRGRLPGIVHRTSDSGATIYVEPSQAVELNNEISNLHSEEVEEVNRLLWELTHEIYLNAEAIVKTLDAIAVIDLVTAKCRFAKAYDLASPELTDESTVSAWHARHPLLVEMQNEKEVAGKESFEVVPIDYRLGEDFDMLIITGPNTGGKTVTLKTIGLITIMVQAGLPVPVAPGSRIGIFSNVLIDIGDEQSMQQSLSTFSAHMKRLLDMLKRAGPKTMVLIDELGAGTDPDEGAAIGRAMLDELLRLNSRCVVTTHIGALKGFALTRERAENGSVEFDAETLCPTYHLRIGEAGSSCAIEIAQRLGMPKRLVSGARRNLSQKAKNLKNVLAGAASIKRQAEDARKHAENARAAARLKHIEAEEAKAKLEKQKTDFQEWVQRVAHLQPGDVVKIRDFDKEGKILRLRLDQQRAEVDVGAFSIEVPLGDIMPPDTPPPPTRAPKPKAVVSAKPTKKPNVKKPTAAPKAKQKDAEDIALPGEPRLPSLTDKQAEKLRPGEQVYAKRFRRQGSVVRVKASKKVVIVTMGVLEVEVPYDGLALPTSARQADFPKRSRTPIQRSKKNEETP